MSTKQKSKQFFRKENKNIRKQILNAGCEKLAARREEEAANWKNNEDYSEIQDVLKELNEAQKSLLSTKKEEEVKGIFFLFVGIRWISRSKEKTLKKRSSVKSWLKFFGWDYEKMIGKILVTGANGSVGGEIINALINVDQPVKAVCP